MADDGPRLGNPARFWGKIMSMVSDRADTRTLWQGIRQEAERDGLGLGPEILRAVTSMRSAAVKLRSASEALGRASDGDVITGSMVAPTIYARRLEGQPIVPQWHVRFTVPVTTDTGTEQRWYMFQYQGQYPQTVGQLRADLAAYASALSGSYGAEFGDVDDVQVGWF